MQGLSDPDAPAKDRGVPVAKTSQIPPGPKPTTPDQCRALMGGLPRRQRLMLGIIAARLALPVWEAWAEQAAASVSATPRHALETAAHWLDARVASQAVDGIVSLVANAAELTPGSPDDDLVHPAWYAAQSVHNACGRGDVLETGDGGRHVTAPATAVIMAALASMPLDEFNPQATPAEHAEVRKRLYPAFFARWWDTCEKVHAV
ncbi:MAG: hypothetical protein AB7K09_16520 [Planctomycetota bacterium]